MSRRRLPNRRPAVTEEIEVADMPLTATVGFDPAGRPAEVFLSGAKDGSGLAAILADAAVVISIALQHGIPAIALGKSLSRVPETIDGPATAPASPIGAALNLLARYERNVLEHEPPPARDREAGGAAEPLGAHSQSRKPRGAGEAVSLMQPPPCRFGGAIQS
jgi:hypothetical protein